MLSPNSSERLRKRPGPASIKALFVASVGWLCAEVMAATAALGQGPTSTTQAASSGAINLGGRGWSAAESRHAASDGGKNQLEFEFRGGLASDYIYRGVTLSDRKPAVGAAIEATYALLYGGVTVASVKLPTQPAAEISMSGGIRPTLGKIDLDLGVTYFRYPGEDPATLSKGIDYWEAAIRGKPSSPSQSGLVGDLRTRRTSPTLGRGANMRLAGSATTYRAKFCRPISACRSLQQPDTPGLATSRSILAAFRFLRI